MKKAFPWLGKKEEVPENGRVVLRGRKVVLREKRLDDAPEDYAWQTDEELARLDATRPIRMSYDEFFRFTKDELIYANASAQRLAIDTPDGRHIGNCMCYDINLRRGEAELGIMIGDREYWSKGFGTDSVETLLSHVFSTTPVKRVYLHTLDWNLRARRAFAKSGFREVKKLRRSGLDFVLMEVLRPEWESHRREQQDAAVDLGEDSGATSG